MLHRPYKALFWVGYLATLLFAFLPIAGNLSKVSIGPPSFEIRLDHLLHFGAYLLICLYYLVGRKLGYRLFRENPLLKFVIVVLLLAMVTEVVQLWVPARAFNPFDLVANLMGLGVGSVLNIIEDQRSKTEDRKQRQ